MHRYVFVAVLALAVASASAQSCDLNGGARNSTEFNSCVTHISKENFASDKITALGACIAQSNRGFTGAQVEKILMLFSYSSDQATALVMMENYLLGMTCSDVAGVLKSFSFSSDRLTALGNFVNVSAIVDLDNNATIIDTFTYSSDKDSAMKLLESMKPRSCVYGRVTAKRVVFVVDTSGSMATTFSLNGQSYTRLSYVSEQLNLVIRDQLAPYQSLNVLRFSNSVQPWQNGIVPVNSANVDSAVSFINGWAPGGGTNIYDAIVAAYSDSDVKAVYLLSDGTPSVGNTDVDAIIAKAADLSAGKTIPLYTVAFLEGANSGDDPAGSKRLMSGLAEATGGVYRLMTQSS